MTLSAIQISLAAVLALGLAGAASAQIKTPTSPSVVFEKNCAACHDHPETRAPDRGTLRRITPEGVYRSLTSGPMAPMAAALPDELKLALAEYVTDRRLTGERSGEASAMTNYCGPAQGALTAKPGDWNGWGNGPGDWRFQAQPGLERAALKGLKLKWAFGLPGAIEAYSQPTIAGGQLFVSSDTGWVYALDAKSGCARWSFQADGGVRTAAVLGEAGGRAMVMFGDIKSNAYGLDARTGKLVWKTQVDSHPLGRITGSPVLNRGVLYVPEASHEEWLGSGSNYPCCTFSGALAAIDAATGKILWKTHTIAEKAKPTRKNSAGVQLWGPAGAAVWGSPAIDEARGLIYISTGDGYTAPAAPTTNSVMALDLKTGKIVWTVQGSAGDSWLGGCQAGGKNPENCPDPTGPDYDFSSGVMLVKTPGGRDLILAGQKSGAVWALDPARKGAIVWRANLALAPPDARGELVWGGASDGSSAYFGLTSGGFAAVDLKDGAVRWRQTVPLAPGRAKGLSGAVSVTPGAMLSGGWDGVVRAVSTEDGGIIWSFDTLRDFQAVNGVPAHGGSMGAPGPVAAGGMVYVSAGGAGVANGTPGNVVLAFGPE
ncbi:MAG: outer membrane protein assembly factor BamB family protein [Caulobacteraceae bacterium]